MQGDDAPTISAGPFLSVFTQNLLGSHCLEPQGILNETDLIALPVAFIQALERGAGEGGAAITKVKALPQSTSLDFALPAMFGFGVILPPAAPARLFLLQVGVAHRAVHATRSQQRCGGFFSHFHRSHPGCFSRQ